MMKRATHLVSILLLIFSCATAFIQESALKDLQTVDHWNTFRIVLSNTLDECFYLETKVNDTVHVIYQVLRGGNSQIRVIITDPLGEVAYSRAGSPFGWYNYDRLTLEGTYRLCFKNEQYFTSKLVYIGVLALHPELISQANLKQEDDKDNSTAVLDEFSARAMQSLTNMSHVLYLMTAHQTIAHVHHASDMYAVEANATYVQNRAICQMILMILCSIIQVMSIRRLFKTTTGSMKSYGSKTTGLTSTPYVFVN